MSRFAEAAMERVETGTRGGTGKDRRRLRKGLGSEIGRGDWSCVHCRAERVLGSQWGEREMLQIGVGAA